MELKDKIAKVEIDVTKVQDNLVNKFDVTPFEAKELSAHALATEAILITLLRDVRNEITKLNVMKAAAYKSAMAALSDKLSVSKQKALAEGDKEHQIAIVHLDKMRNNKEYIKGMIDVCADAHKFYKAQMNG